MADTAERLADELEERLGDKPIRPRDLVAKLVALDTAVLVRFLDDALTRAAGADEEDDLDESVWGPDPTDDQLADARKQAARSLADALRAALDDALTRSEAAERLGITPQAVSKRLAAGGLVALRRGRERRFPAWQFQDGDVLPGLADVIVAYPGSPLALTHWATTPSHDLDGATPAQALTRRDGLSRVLEAAGALTPAAW
jgi:excisionase family DNA binding protein